jgi:hypothetical protein
MTRALSGTWLATWVWLTMPFFADAELFRPAADAAACSRRLQSRQRAFADDIALELGLLQLPAKR